MGWAVIVLDIDWKLWSEEKLQEVNEWLAQHTKSGYRLVGKRRAVLLKPENQIRELHTTEGEIEFENGREAMLFKLTWGGYNVANE